MARTALTVTPVGRTGNRAITLVSGDDVNGHEFDNASGKNMLLVNNGSASPVTVTIETVATIDGLSLPDLAVEVAAGDEAVIGPFPSGTYNQANDKVNVNLSAGGATVKVGVLVLP